MKALEDLNKETQKKEEKEQLKTYPPDVLLLSQGEEAAILKDAGFNSLFNDVIRDTRSALERKEALNEAINADFQVDKIYDVSTINIIASKYNYEFKGVEKYRGTLPVGIVDIIKKVSKQLASGSRYQADILSIMCAASTFQGKNNEPVYLFARIKPGYFILLSTWGEEPDMVTSVVNSINRKSSSSIAFFTSVILLILSLVLGTILPAATTTSMKDFTVWVGIYGLIAFFINAVFGNPFEKDDESVDVSIVLKLGGGIVFTVFCLFASNWSNTTEPVIKKCIEKVDVTEKLLQADPNQVEAGYRYIDKYEVLYKYERGTFPFIKETKVEKLLVKLKEGED